ncbi:hypothetical protein NY98_22260 [Xanthomonas citri pv. fuscans]|uniref:Uncharacterized protein n=1 Tax=Xanthomonas citri pv. fuscans TaxID=366649 RepID=A0AB34SS43_XANCI|nr:hypothetical protein AC613_19430 [Xanthomonas citri pv. fuscans]KKY03358.1 hypothetical protein NY65_23130 [Xanthomonas phaseoli pv. phaseoli]AZU23083.1 hypothetical protein AC612_19425 [Xanthomonas citri pv. fuscans]AZU94409.1 hypothetical protein AC614_19430 [Xanthomonas citri pv. fuscans]KGT52081.2 hypothetical protein NY96_23605 [Xanthomonas citri pv. fuscans]
MRSVLWRVETRRALRPRLAAWARRATQYRRATGRFPAGWPPAARSGRRAACLGTAKPAPRSTRSAPLAANASHLNVHNTL